VGAPRDAAETLLDLFVLIQSRTGGRYFQLMERQGISVTQYRALTTLARMPGSLSVKELAAALGLSSPATSRMAEDMVRRGWVAREEDGRDRRQKQLRATPEGRDALRALDEARLSELTRFLDRLGAEERAALVDAVGPVLALGAAADAAPAAGSGRVGPQ
jgi:DNA-binding MarR family transcriptional regulator